MPNERYSNAGLRDALQNYTGLAQASGGYNKTAWDSLLSQYGAVNTWQKELDPEQPVVDQSVQQPTMPSNPAPPPPQANQSAPMAGLAGASPTPPTQSEVQADAPVKERQEEPTSPEEEIKGFQSLTKATTERNMMNAMGGLTSPMTQSRLTSGLLY